MSWTDKHRAQRRWAYEDRARDVSPYGIRKPSRRPAKRSNKQFKEGLFTLGVCVMLALVVTGQ
jgi:hypothetical protein